MLARQLYDLRADLRRRGVVFAYSGYVSDDILGGVGEALRRKMASEEAARGTIRSVFAVFVEQMQNVIRYSAERLEGGGAAAERLSYGILVIGRDEASYVVHSGNVIDPSEVAPLRARLAGLAAMDEAELRAAYKARLHDAAPTVGGGAGVGLIDIARRASRPIGFDFLDMEDGRTFFAIEARIGAAA